MSGFAALLVVATFALASCGGDDGPATPTATTAGATAIQTVTETRAATATTTATSPPATSGTSGATSTTTAKEPASAPPSTSATTTPEATAQRRSGACPNVEVGAREGDVDVTYARIEQARKVDCATAALVAAQWGRQQLGLEKALLPLGWECRQDGVCTNDASRVSFVLVRPG